VNFGEPFGFVVGLRGLPMGVDVAQITLATCGAPGVSRLGDWRSRARKKEGRALARARPSALGDAERVYFTI